MLLHQFSEVQRLCRRGKLDPRLVRFLLQSLPQGNLDYAAVALRPTFVTLRQPTHTTIERWLDANQEARHHLGIDPALRSILASFNWNAGPQKLDLTVVTAKNIFLRGDTYPHETEQQIRAEAKLQWLRPCPDWIVPALALWAEANGLPGNTGGLNVNFCLASDSRERLGCGMGIRKNWFLYHRHIDEKPDRPLNWVFAKRRLQFAD